MPDKISSWTVKKSTFQLLSSDVIVHSLALKLHFTATYHIMDRKQTSVAIVGFSGSLGKATARGEMACLLRLSDRALPPAFAARPEFTVRVINRKTSEV